MKVPRLSRVAAFTLVEIALALAIIGFALVAIIGVLPFGLNVQKENREETIVVQDASYFLDAIRTGARGLDDLTNYVEAITNVVYEYEIIPDDPPRTNQISGPVFLAYRYENAWLAGVPRPASVITNGARIIALLSTPKYEFEFGNPTSALPTTFYSNYVVAYVQALSGPAVEKAPQTNVFVRDLAFRYRLVPEIIPFENWNDTWVNFSTPGLSTNDIITRSNAWRMARNKQANLHEVRLLFRWPLNSRREAGNQRQVFRTQVSGVLQATNLGMNHDVYLMQPREFQTVQ